MNIMIKSIPSATQSPSLFTAPEVRTRAYNTNNYYKEEKRKKNTSAIRAPALLSLLQDLRTNIVKSTTVTVYEFNSTGGARRVHGSTYILN